MNKCLMSAAIGFAIGIMIGYHQEEEIDDLCRQSKKAKRRMKKKYHKICDCVHID